MNDAKALRLDFAHQANIDQIIKKERMDWEPWIESAPNFAVLKQRLYQRGYRSLPMTDKPALLKKKTSITQDVIDKLPNQRTMMRRGSRSRR